MRGGYAAPHRVWQEAHAPILRRPVQRASHDVDQGCGRARVEQHRATAAAHGPRTQCPARARRRVARQRFGRDQGLNPPFLRLAEIGNAATIVLRQHHRPARIVGAQCSATEPVAGRQGPQALGGQGHGLPGAQPAVRRSDFGGNPVQRARCFQRRLGTARAVAIEQRRGAGKGQAIGRRQIGIGIGLDMRGDQHRLFHHAVDRRPVESRGRGRSPAAIVKHGQAKALAAAALGHLDLAIAHCRLGDALMPNRGARPRAALGRLFDRPLRGIAQGRLIVGQQSGHAAPSTRAKLAWP